MPSLFIVLVLSSVLATSQATVKEKLGVQEKPLSYSGFQVWSFKIRSSAERAQLNKFRQQHELEVWKESQADEADETIELPSPLKVVEEIVVYPELKPEPKMKLADPKSKLNNPNGNAAFYEISYTKAISDNGNAKNNVNSLNTKAELKEGKEPQTDKADETIELPLPIKVVQEVVVYPELKPEPKMKLVDPKSKLNNPNGNPTFSNGIQTSYTKAVSDNGDTKNDMKSLNAKIGPSVLKDQFSHETTELWRWNNPEETAEETIDMLLPPQVVEKLVMGGPTEPEPKMKLADAHISYQIKISDLQAVIDMGNAKNNISSLNKKVGHSMDWISYHRLGDIYGYLYYLANKHSSGVELIKIGTSYEKRPLYVVRIFNSSSSVVKPAIWIDGGIHAREWLSPAVTTYIIRQLVEVKANAALLNNVDWYIMPIMNPDGYEYSHVSNRLWRKTRSLTSFGGCRGVDPNRNFGYKWGGLGTSTNPCSNVYKGTSAFSEPETLATSNFIKGKVKSIKLYLTLHSFGQAALIPWGYDVAYPTDYADMLSLAKKAVSKFTKYRYWVGNSAALLYPAAGASDDWAKSIGIKYSYTFELPNIGSYGFLLPPSNILPVCQDFFPALDVFAAKIATLKV